MKWFVCPQNSSQLLDWKTFLNENLIFGFLNLFLIRPKHSIQTERIHLNWMKFQAIHKHAWIYHYSGCTDRRRKAINFSNLNSNTWKIEYPPEYFLLGSFFSFGKLDTKVKVSLTTGFETSASAGTSFLISFVGFSNFTVEQGTTMISWSYLSLSDFGIIEKWGETFLWCLTYSDHWCARMEGR